MSEQKKESEITPEEEAQTQGISQSDEDHLSARAETSKKKDYGKTSLIWGIAGIASLVVYFVLGSIKVSSEEGYIQWLDFFGFCSGPLCGFVAVGLGVAALIMPGHSKAYAIIGFLLGLPSLSPLLALL